MAGSPQIVLLVRSSDDGPPPPDFWGSIGVGSSPDDLSQHQLCGKRTTWL